MPFNKLQDIELLRRAVALADKAKIAGNHPFGALLADAAGKVLIEAGNAFATEKGPGHAEIIVARQAAVNFEPEFLQTCTLVTSVEPCAMCAGAIYWANIGTLVFGLTEKRLAQLTGDNEENLTMDLPCRAVFESGQRRTTVRGPYLEVENEIAEPHRGFW